MDAKEPNQNNQYQKIVPFILFVLALFLLFNLVKPMITILLGSALLAYVAFPIYLRVRKKIPNKTVSIIVSLIGILLVISIPFTFLVIEITQQGSYFYDSLSNGITKGALFGFGCTSADSKVCSLINQAEKFSLQKLSAFGLDKQLEKILPVFEDKITQFMLSIPLRIAEIFITFVIAYFILYSWKNILRKIVDLLPMKTKTINRLTREFQNITYTVIYAQLFVAAVQGIVGAVGFYLSGVPFPIFFGVIMAFCALIPTIGTAIIWLPASLFLILQGYFSNDYWVLAKGIGLLFYGLFIISTIDNVLLATIVHKRTKVNQILVIIGVIGGGVMFGFIGIFIGPILLLLLITYFETFRERFS